MNRYINFSKINIKNLKLPLTITFMVSLSQLIQMAIMLIIQSTDSIIIGIGNFFLMNLVMFPIFTSIKNFRKFLNLGMKKEDFKYGKLFFYTNVSIITALLNILFYFIEKNLLINTSLTYINLLDIFGWFNFGLIGCIIYQTFAYLVLMYFVDFLTISNHHLIGWITSGILIAFVSVFSSIRILRIWFGQMLKFILFNENILMQIIIDLSIIIALFIINNWFIQKKEL